MESLVIENVNYHYLLGDIDGKIKYFMEPEIQFTPVRILRKLAQAGNIPSKIYQYSDAPTLKHYLVHGYTGEEERPDVKEIKQELKTDLASAIADAIKDKLHVQPEIDVEALNKTIDEKFNTLKADLLKSTVKTIVIEDTVKHEKRDLGLQHHMFEQVLRLTEQGFNIWLYGEAGSGKTQMAENIAKALDLSFFAQSVSNQTTKSDLLGFIDANGNFAESLFYKAYANGGLFLLDEVDNGNSNVLNVINAATSNGIAAFPCGMTPKNPKFRLICGANTIGEGANRQYVGRNTIDLALKTRFIFVKLDTDWTLVKNLLTAAHGNKYDSFYERCMSIRYKILSLNLTNILVTSRTVLQGAQLLAMNIPESTVLEMVLYKGCDESTKNKIS